MILDVLDKFAPEEERQKIKDLLFILEKNNVSESV
jgi:hypothetical protein